jgi:hypothetical protein
MSCRLADYRCRLLSARFSTSSPHSVCHLLYNILIVGYAISELCRLKLEKKRGKTVHSILYLKQKIVPRVKPTWVKKISPLLYPPPPRAIYYATGNNIITQFTYTNQTVNRAAAGRWKASSCKDFSTVR